MGRSLMIVLGILLAALLFAQPANPEPRVRIELVSELDLFPEMTRLLHTKVVKMEGSLKGITLKQLLDILEEQCDRKIRFVLRQDIFNALGPDFENMMEKPFHYDIKWNGLVLHEFLRLALYDVKAAHLVRTNYIEITPIDVVTDRIILFDQEKPNEDYEAVLLDMPLVSGVFQDKSLADVMDEWGKAYGLTISVSGFADITAKNAVSARIMNVPLPTAVELLAAKLQLVAVQKDGVIMVTTADHAKFLAWQPIGKSVVFRKRYGVP